MGDHPMETPAQVRAFAPKHKPDGWSDSTDDTGKALIAMLQKAAKLLTENGNRARALVHEFSTQLEANNDRIGQLEADVELFRHRATNAEKWLQLIHKEIETRLMTKL